jgi:hypothetical protein
MPEWLGEMPIWEIIMFSVIGVGVVLILILYFTEKVGKKTFEGTSFVLAVFAIAFAVIQFYDAKEHSHGLRLIDKAVSTRFIGVFPKNLVDIGEVVAGTDKQLDVMVDFVGYGHYSAPVQFEAYLRKIEDLRQRNIPFRMLVYELKKAHETHASQFTQQIFNDVSGAKNGKPDVKFVAFCNKFNQGHLPKTKAEFDELLFHKQQDYIVEMLERGVQVRKTTSEMPFYLWNQDDQDAVFSFLNADNKGDREVSFRTRDSNIVKDAFKRRFDAYWEHSQDIHLIVVQGNHTIDW